MIKQKCECGWIGDDDELKHTRVSDPFGTGDSWYTEIEVNCPECGSDYIEEVVMCDSCHEVEAAEGLDECEKCFAENES